MGKDSARKIYPRWTVLPSGAGLPSVPHISSDGMGASKQDKVCSRKSGDAFPFAQVHLADKHTFHTFISTLTSLCQISLALFRSSQSFPRTSVDHVN